MMISAGVNCILNPILVFGLKFGIAVLSLAYGIAQAVIVYGGTPRIAVLGLASSLINLMLMPVLGIRQSVKHLVGYNFGTKNLDLVRI
jgi:Na+-driven multidrug efflux pump